MQIGDGFNGSSLTTVTGTGSALNVSNELRVGDDCGCTVGTLTVADDGAVTAGSTKIGTGSTLNLGTGGLAGSISTPTIENNGQIAANFTDVLALAAAISGSGSLTKDGSGMLTLSGVSTYTGPTSVVGGTLAVTGSIVSDVTVGGGATLKGTGSVGSVTVNGGGTLAPGSSPGTLTVSGSLAMASTTIYLVQVTPAIASTTNVSGSAAIAGTVNVVASPGSYAPGTKYTILTTAGAGTVSGQFSGVSVISGSFGSNVTPKLSYDAHDVFLTLALNSISSLLPPNLSGNQQNVANAINVH